jgi:hypothetical protein
MNPIATSGTVLAFTFVAAVWGALLRRVIPDRHLSDQGKDAIKLVTGLVASMVALILGLLVWSSKSYFDTQATELTKISAEAVLLDRMLALYGARSERGS